MEAKGVEVVPISTMEELTEVINEAVAAQVSLGLFIEMPGFDMPELITNPPINLKKKLQYYQLMYDDALNHRNSKGIRIVAFML